LYRARGRLHATYTTSNAAAAAVVVVGSFARIVGVDK